MHWIRLVLILILSDIYLFIASFQDLKERKLHVFPSIILTVCYFFHVLAEKSQTERFLIIYVCSNLLIGIFLSLYHAWGCGDSYLFVLLSMNCLAVWSKQPPVTIFFYESLSLIVTMVIASIVCFLECIWKQERWNLRTDAALAPGFAVVTFFLTWMTLEGGCGG